MFCCCCSVLSLTYVFAAFELTAYQTTATWLTITILHSSQYIGYVFFMHTSTEYGQHLIKSHRFPLPPCALPLPPRCPPPTSDSWRRPCYHLGLSLDLRDGIGSHDSREEDSQMQALGSRFFRNSTWNLYCNVQTKYFDVEYFICCAVVSCISCCVFL